MKKTVLAYCKSQLKTGDACRYLKEKLGQIKAMIPETETDSSSNLTTNTRSLAPDSAEPPAKTEAKDLCTGGCDEAHSNDQASNLNA